MPDAFGANPGASRYTNERHALNSRGASKKASSIGMMDSAFFVGRIELLQWVNSLCGLKLQKVEQCSSGAVYCQILDAAWWYSNVAMNGAPNSGGVVNMRKLNWMGRKDFDYIPNYKVLQAGFDRQQIERNIDVDKLVRGKYQDNLEFLQWMKCYFESAVGGSGVGVHGRGVNGMLYDAAARREGKSLPIGWAGEGMTASSSSGGGDGAGSAADAAPGTGGVNGARVNPRTRNAKGSGKGSGYAQQNQRRTAPGGNAAQVAEVTRRQQEQEEELNDLRITVEGLETERDYYFKKLREIEVLTQTLEGEVSVFPVDPVTGEQDRSKLDGGGHPGALNKEGGEYTTDSIPSGSLVKAIQDILYKEEGEEGAAGGE